MNYLLSVVIIFSWFTAGTALAQDMRAVQVEADKAKAMLAARAAEEKAAASEEARKKRQYILSDRSRLEKAIDELEKRRTSLEEEVTVLTEEKTVLDEKEQVLNQELAGIGNMVNELVGVIRINAKDIDALIRDNLQTALLKDPPSFIEEIGTDARFPGMDDVTAMVGFLFDQVRRSQEVMLTDLPVIDRAGSERPAKVLTAGPFSAVYELDGELGFLRYSPDERSFYALSRLPAGRVQKMIKQYMQGEAEAVPIDITRGAALRQLTHQMGLFAQIPKGGPLVWPIAILFLTGVLIVLERIVFLLRHRVNSEALIGDIRQAVEQSNWQDALSFCKDYPKKPVARVLKSGLQSRELEREEMENVLQEAILQEIPPMERFLSTLGMLATIAPLLGLLGTVTGMIDTFHIITLHGTGDPRLMSGGISEALVTTMLGLSVAIPLMLAQNLLNRAVDKEIGTMEEKAVGLVNLIHKSRIPV